MTTPGDKSGAVNEAKSIWANAMDKALPNTLVHGDQFDDAHAATLKRRHPPANWVERCLRTGGWGGVALSQEGTALHLGRGVLVHIRCLGVPCARPTHLPSTAAISVSSAIPLSASGIRWSPAFPSSSVPLRSERWGVVASDAVVMVHVESPWCSRVHNFDRIEPLQAIAIATAKITKSERRRKRRRRRRRRRRKNRYDTTVATGSNTSTVAGSGSCASGAAAGLALPFLPDIVEIDGKYASGGMPERMLELLLWRSLRKFGDGARTTAAAAARVAENGTAWTMDNAETAGAPLVLIRCGGTATEASTTHALANVISRVQRRLRMEEVRRKERRGRSMSTKRRLRKCSKDRESGDDGEGEEPDDDYKEEDPETYEEKDDHKETLFVRHFDTVLEFAEGTSHPVDGSGDFCNGLGPRLSAAFGETLAATMGEVGVEDGLPALLVLRDVDVLFPPVVRAAVDATVEDTHPLRALQVFVADLSRHAVAICDERQRRRWRQRPQDRGGISEQEERVGGRERIRLAVLALTSRGIDGEFMAAQARVCFPFSIGPPFPSLSSPSRLVVSSGPSHSLFPFTPILSPLPLYSNSRSNLLLDAGLTRRLQRLVGVRGAAELRSELPAVVRLAAIKWRFISRLISSIGRGEEPERKKMEREWALGDGGVRWAAQQLFRRNGAVKPGSAVSNAAVVAAAAAERRGTAAAKSRQKGAEAAQLLTCRGKAAFGFDRVFGLDDAKQALTEALVWPHRHSRLFHHFFGLRRREGSYISPLLSSSSSSMSSMSVEGSSVLLYGPPGTGKTSLARAAAEETGARLLELSAADIVRSTMGTSETALRKAFAEARKLNSRSKDVCAHEISNIHDDNDDDNSDCKNGRGINGAGCFIFIDEFQSLFAKRGSGGGDGGSMATLLLQLMDDTSAAASSSSSSFSSIDLATVGCDNFEEIRGGRSGRVTVLAATNVPEAADVPFYGLVALTMSSTARPQGCNSARPCSPPTAPSWASMLTVLTAAAPSTTTRAQCSLSPTRPSKHLCHHLWRGLLRAQRVLR